MQILWTILTLIQPDCYIATFDLKGVYYSVTIDNEETRFLKSLYSSKLLNFVA